jgi:hypothetical protein
MDNFLHVRRGDQNQREENQRAEEAAEARPRRRWPG